MLLKKIKKEFMISNCVPCTQHMAQQFKDICWLSQNSAHTESNTNISFFTFIFGSDLGFLADAKWGQ